MLQPKNWRKWAIFIATLPVAVTPLLLLNTTAPKTDETAREIEAPTSDIAEPPSTPQIATTEAEVVVSEPPAKPSTMPRKATVNTAGVEQWRELVAQYPWPVDEALAVMKAESGGNTHAVSPTNDHGLMQINWRWQSRRVAKMGGSLESLYDPSFNVQVAYAIYSEQGWCPWYAARKIGVAKGCN